MGYNPVINLFRLLTPRLRTPEEHSLKERNLKIFRSAFGEVNVRYFHLLSLAALPFGGSALFRRAYQLLESADTLLFSLWPGLEGWHGSL